MIGPAQLMIRFACNRIGPEGARVAALVVALPLLLVLVEVQSLVGGAVPAWMSPVAWLVLVALWLLLTRRLRAEETVLLHWTICWITVLAGVGLAVAPVVIDSARGTRRRA